MYLFIIILTMLVAPLLSVAIEFALDTSADLVGLSGKWFVFWGLGVRLLLAAFKQIADPGFTAKSVFRIEDPAAEKLVSEIGFGNLAIGSLALLSLAIPAWTAPAAFAGALFLALAGIKHAINADRTAKENIAMLSDLAIAALLAGFLILQIARHGLQGLA